MSRSSRHSVSARSSVLPRSGIPAATSRPSSSRLSRATPLPSNRRLARADQPPRPPSSNPGTPAGISAPPPSTPGRASGPGRASSPHARPAEPNKKPKRRAKKTKKKRWVVGPRLKTWMNRLSLMTGIIVVISASVLVAWGLRRYLRTSPRFSVRTVAVEGNLRRTPHEIAKTAGIETGRNVFTIDERQAEGLVTADPWVESATVEVELPNQVRITVVEREARAQAVIDGLLYLVDSEGNVFKKLAAGDPEDMAVITGMNAEALARDREAVAAQARRALALVEDLGRGKMGRRFPVQEVHVDDDGSVTLVIGTDGLTLVFGRPPYRAKVDKAERILEELRFRKVKRATLFLDNEAHPERVVVRMK